MFKRAYIEAKGNKIIESKKQNYIIKEKVLLYAFLSNIQDIHKI